MIVAVSGGYASLVWTSWAAAMTRMVRADEGLTELEFDWAPERGAALDLDLDAPGARAGVLIELALCLVPAESRARDGRGLGSCRLALPSFDAALQLIATRFGGHDVGVLSADAQRPGMRIATHLVASLADRSLQPSDEPRRSEAQRRVSAVRSFRVQAHGYALHPRITQLICELGSELVASTSGVLEAVPVAFESLWVGYDGLALGEIRIAQRSETAVDAWVLAQDGSLVAVMRGLRFATDELARDAAEELLALRVARIAEHVLGRGPLPLAASLADLGLSSLDLVRVVSALQRETGCTLRPAELNACGNLLELARSLERLSRDSSRSASRNALVRVARPHGVVPATAGQRRFWILSRLEDDPAAYHVHLRLDWNGELHASALCGALSQLDARHSALRTVFRERANGDLEQCVEPSGLHVEQLDLTGYEHEARTLVQQRLEAEHRRSPFDLERGPLYRVALLRLAERSFRLLFTFHHIAVDGWSLALYFRELLEGYTRSVLELSPMQRTPAYDCVDIAAWERCAEREEERARSHEHWRRVLAAVPALDLPSEPVPADAPPTRGETLDLPLSDELAARIRALARRERATTVSVFAAAYAWVLARHSGQPDVAIGATASGRSRVELADVVGPLVSLIVLRMHANERDGLATLVARMHAVILDAVSHQEPPLDALMSVARRDGAGAGPVRAAIVHEAWELPQTVAGAELTWELDTRDAALPGASRFDIELLIAEQGPRLRAQLRFRSRLFARATIELIAAQLCAALERGTRQPDSTLLELSADADVKDLACELDEPLIPTLAEQLSRGMSLDPDAVALVHRGRTRTYAELDARVRRIAASLASAGVKPEQCVAVRLERGFELVEAILAVLHVGAAYLPLDVRLPRERTHFMLGDSDTRIVLTAGSLAADLPPAVRAIALDDLPELESEGRPGSAHDDRSLAYLMYTSGSTGQPKGVLIERRNLASFFVAMDHAVVESGRATWLATTTASFDMSVTELLWPIARGRKVVIGELGTGACEAFDFVDDALQHGVTHLQCTPTVAASLLEDPQGRRLLAAASHLIVGGEALRPWLAARLRETVSNVTNMYGPTEATVFATAWPVPANPSRVLIGTPLRGTSLSVIDEEGRPVPCGMVGELVIRGRGVARGYHERPSENARRFATAASGSRSRSYRTGDLARQRADGSVELLGRNDRQVKIMGHRVELEEVEAALQRLPEVAHAVVVARPAAASASLTAYVVPRAGLVSLGAGLRARLRSLLPAAMVPAQIRVVDRLPLTASGKTDVGALVHSADFAPASPSAPRRAPATPDERLLVELWRHLLERSELGIDEDVFELGASSLDVIRLVSLLRSRQRELTSTDVFEWPTISGQAARLKHRVRRDLRLDLEASLEATIECRAPTSRAPVRRVLLTGATGFLGAHLLHELTQAAGLDVVCLVRAPDQGAAFTRLEQALRSRGLPSTSLQRTSVVCGDVSMPRLGLDDAAWYWLSRHVQAIVHDAAQVSFVAPYSVLRATNVQGTRELLRLACTGAAKPFHFVSTVAVAEAHSAQLPPAEHSPLTSWQLLADGYSQSKWVAERLVFEAGARGLPVTVYRPGLIVGGRDSPQLPHNHVLLRALSAIAASGACFEPGPRRLSHITSVDDVARVLVRLAFESDSGGSVFHLVNPESHGLAELLAWLRECGVPCATLPYSQWRERSEREAPEAWATLLSRIETHEELVPRVDCSWTQSRLQSLDEHWTPFDCRSLGRIVATLAGPSRPTRP